jgi:hypothetical protein
VSPLRGDWKRNRSDDHRVYHRWDQYLNTDLGIGGEALQRSIRPSEKRYYGSQPLGFDSLRSLSRVQQFLT